MTASATTANGVAERTILGHPRGLVNLFFTEMWERLSYYGMRALLVLFMTDQIINGGMALDDVTATALWGRTSGCRCVPYIAVIPGRLIEDII